jgi:asparagine synthase (glutamine-hydrolysing)
MCGINGIISLKNETLDANKVAAMNEVINHRGPDYSGVYANENVALGHVRLSIIDLSNAGNQPMISADGNVVLAFNGEIYNFKKLKQQLDYPFITQTDSEVLIAAYLKWGSDMCKYLEGMFAFVIYDKLKQQIIIARDRLGIKPLYFYNNQSHFVFSSEIRGVLESGIVQRKLNSDLIPMYFTLGSVCGESTLVEDVKLMPPGSIMQIANGVVSTSFYWKLNEVSEKFTSGYAECKNEVRRLFFEAIEKRLVADVPFGAFLSGGIDSTAVTAVMSKISDKPIHTFNVNFDESEFSESKYAKIVAEKFNTIHTEINLKPSIFLEEIDAILKSYDHPSNDGANTYIVSKATKEAGITMALSGLGGDEVFGGYPVFRKHDAVLKRLSRIPYPLRLIIINYLKKYPTVRNKKLSELLSARNIDLPSVYASFRKLCSQQDLEYLLKLSFKFDPNKFFLGKSNHSFSEISEAETYYYMQPVLLRDADQMSMAHALEIRVPFLDHALVEYVHQVPDSFKYKAQYPKSLLVDALQDLLPQDIIFRKKMGFVLPWEKWMKKELNYLVTNAIKDGGSFINKSQWELAYHDFCAGKNNLNWNIFWSLVTLTQWMKNNQVSAS